MKFPDFAPSFDFDGWMGLTILSFWYLWFFANFIITILTFLSVPFQWIIGVTYNYMMYKKIDLTNLGISLIGTRDGFNYRFTFKWISLAILILALLTVGVYFKITSTLIVIACIDVLQYICLQRFTPNPVKIKFCF